MMVASTPLSVDDRLTMWRTQLNAARQKAPDGISLPPELVEAENLLDIASTLNSSTDGKIDNLARKKAALKKLEDGDVIQAEQTEVEQAQASLATTLQRLFEIFPDENDTLQEFMGDINRADPHAQRPLIAAINDNLVLYGAVTGWAAVQPILEQEDAVKEMTEQPLEPGHDFGIAVHEDQAIPALTEARDAQGLTTDRTTAHRSLGGRRRYIHSGHGPYGTSA